MTGPAFLSTLVVAGLAAGTLAGPAAAGSPCAKRGSRTVRADSEVRVYTFTAKGEQEWVACRKRTGGRTTLTSFATYGGEHFVTGLNVSGLYVGLTERYSGPDYTDDTLIWARAGKGSRVRSVGAGRPFTGLDIQGSTGIGPWALSPNGNIGFTALYHDEIRVAIASVGGAPKVLDESKSGPDGISVDSLALASDNTLYWRHGAETRSAPLPPPSR